MSGLSWERGEFDVFMRGSPPMRLAGWCAAGIGVALVAGGVWRVFATRSGLALADISGRCSETRALRHAGAIARCADWEGMGFGTTPEAAMVSLSALLRVISAAGRRVTTPAVGGMAE